MMDYISREAAKLRVVEALGQGKSPYNAIVMLPAADVREVVTCKECIRCVNDGVYNCVKHGIVCCDGDFYCRDGKKENGADMREEQT